MKKVTSIVAFFVFPLFIYAQHCLESGLNMFRADDVLIKQQVEYKDPGRSGANVLWDFSQLTLITDEYELDYSFSPRSYTAEGKIEDSYITGSEHRTRYHYSLENDSLFLWGFQNSTTLLQNSQPELLLRFPMLYGDSIRQHYYGHGKYGNRLELDVMGTIHTCADSYGMMILPNKDTLTHVLRTHTIKYIAEEMRPVSSAYREKHNNPPYLSPDSIDYRLSNDSVLFVVETFRWYEKGYRYPIFETVRSWEQHKGDNDYQFLNTAFFYPPQDHYYLEEDEANRALLDDEDDAIPDPWAGLSYNIYPNPVKTDFGIEIYLPRNTNNIRIQLRSTMGGIEYDANKGAYAEGTCSFIVPTSSLPIGNYILDIWLDEKLINEIILKR